LICSVPVTGVTVGVPQTSVAVAVPSAASIVPLFGFPQKNVIVPVAVMVGGVTSTVHVTVLDAVAEFPQPSIAVHVLVCERLHPVLWVTPSTVVTVGVPQASVTVAAPSPASIAAVDGLQPTAPFVGLPVVVIVGAVTSDVHIALRDVVDVLPQPSVAVNVLL